MELKFTKQNLVLLLLVAYRRRGDGLFLGDLIDHQTKAVRACNDRTTLPAPVRATWYNYFSDIKSIFPEGIAEEDIKRLAQSFIAEHPKLSEKFYRKFSKVTFESMRDFFIERGLINNSIFSGLSSGEKNSLYFSILDFLGPRVSSAEDHVTVPGIYRVYRPSLSTPGKVLVSAARFRSNSDGSLHYREKMHFKVEYGWREQYLDGYLVGVEGRGFLITRDDNTRLMQMIILKPLSRKSMPDGTSKIMKLAGSYSGASSARANGLFSTGIVMLRDRLDKIERYPVRSWKIGLLGPFGLKDKDEVPESVLPHLFE